jgi:signal transduction histidine kinase/DNA-binding response OmpR family regulator
LKQTQTLRIAAVAIGSMLLGALIVGQMERDRLEQEQHVARAIAQELGTSIRIRLDQALSTTYVLAALVREGNGRVDHLASLGAGLLPMYRGITALELAPAGVVRQVYSLHNSRGSAGQNLFRDPATRQAARRARDTGLLSLSIPTRMEGGGTGVVSCLAVSLPDRRGRPRFWGLAVVTVRLEDLVQETAVNRLGEYRYSLSHIRAGGLQRVFFRSSGAGLESPVTYDVRVPGGRWTLALEPARGWFSPGPLAVQSAVALVFCLLATLFAFSGEQQRLARWETDQLNRELAATSRGLEEMVQKAEAANRAKSAFLATMSHEIRTPMNAVINMADLALETGLDATQRQYVSTIASSGRSLLGLINDILDFSKIEADRLELERVPFSLRALLEEIAAVFRTRERGQQVELVLQVDPETPDGLVGDPLRLRQVLVNLLGNAFKFTERGEIVVSVAPVGTPAEDRCELRFSVRDTGIGIPVENQDRLFQAFSQVDSSTARRYGGTGLGLAISQRLVSAMEGELGVRSEPGQGSEFFFTARFGLGAPAAVPEPERLCLRFDGARVLVAEDHDANRLVVQELLAQAGIQAEFAADGEEAVRMARETQYDAVLMDIQMPRLDGLEATRRIRAEQDGRSLPIIALTANAVRGDAELCRAAGMDDYLSKPIDRASLLRALSRWLPCSLDSGPEPAAAGSGDAPALETLAIADPEAVAAALKPLEAALADFDLDATAAAMERLERLSLPGEWRDDLARLRRQIDGYDYTEAARTVAELRSRGVGGAVG